MRAIVLSLCLTGLLAGCRSVDPQKLQALEDEVATLTSEALLMPMTQSQYDRVAAQGVTIRAHIEELAQ